MKKKSVIKYIKRIGQKTGMSKMEKKVQKIEMRRPLVRDHLKGKKMNQCQNDDYNRSTGRFVLPKFELWQSPDERLELITDLYRKTGTF